MKPLTRDSAQRYSGRAAETAVARDWRPVRKGGYKPQSVCPAAFLSSGVPSMGGRAGGAERLAGCSFPVRQLPFGRPPRLASGCADLPSELKEHIMAHPAQGASAPVTRARKALRKSSSPLKINTRKQGFDRLPFVASSRTKTAAANWSVPGTGGYLGGYTTGEALALAFLKHLRGDESDITPSWLTWVSESFAVRFEQEGGAAMSCRRVSERTEGYDSFCGQRAGFMNTLQRWLSASAKHLGSALDDLDEAELVRRANAGLAFDESVLNS